MTTILLLIALGIMLTVAYAGYQGAPWVPTKKIDIERVIRLANIQPGDVFYDLGCGDGRVLFAAAEKGAMAKGHELALPPFIAALIRRLKQKERKHIFISFKNSWKADLHDANIVYFFLTRDVTQKMKEKLEKELKSGTRVIAYVWPIKDWDPIKKDELEGHPPIYVYER